MQINIDRLVQYALSVVDQLMHFNGILWDSKMQSDFFPYFTIKMSRWIVSGTSSRLEIWKSCQLACSHVCKLQFQ